jgi:hypothetical protein
MGYGNKYRYQYVEATGQTCEVQIQQEGYSGSVTDLSASNQGFEITWAQQGQQDLTKPLLVSTARLWFEGDADGEMVKEVFDSGDTEWRVRYLVGGSLEWQGYLATDLWRSDPHSPSDTIALEAIDGLALLEDRDAYVDDTTSTYRPHSAIDAHLRGFDSYEGLHNLPIRTSMDWRPYDLDLPEPGKDCPLDWVDLRNKSFQELDDQGEPQETLDARSQLEGLVERFGLQLFQAGGTWHLRQRDQVEDGTALKTWTMEVDQSIFGDAQTTDVTAELPHRLRRSEKPQRRVERLRTLTSTYNYEDLGNLAENGGFEDYLSAWEKNEPSNGDAQSRAETVTYDNSSLERPSTQENTRVARINRDVAGPREDPVLADPAEIWQTAPAHAYNAGPNSSILFEWMEAHYSKITRPTIKIKVGSWYLERRLTQVTSTSLAAKEGTLYINSLPSGAVIPSGSRCHIYDRDGDPRNDPEHDLTQHVGRIDLSQAAREGDDVLQGDISAEIPSGSYVQYYTWSSSQQEITCPQLFEVKTTMVPQSINAPTRAPDGSVVSGKPYFYFTIAPDNPKTAADKYIYLDDVSAQMAQDGEPIGQTVYSSLDDHHGRDLTLNHRIGVGPSAGHPRALFDQGTAEILSDWKRGPYGSSESRSGKGLEQLLAETWMRQQRETLDRRTYQFEERGAQVGPQYVYSIDSTPYTVSYLRYRTSSSGNGGVIELSEHKDAGIAGLQQNYSMDREGTTTTSGTAGGSTAGGGGGGSASSWEQLTGKPFSEIGGGLKAPDDFLQAEPSGFAGLGLTDNSDTLAIADGGVDTLQLAGAAVTEPKLQDDAVTAPKVRDGETLPVDISGDADTVDGYEGAELGVLAEDETITGTWTHEADLVVDGAKMEADTFGTAAFGFSEKGGDLVLTDANGIELIRQPKGGATQFVQGAEIGVIDAPADSLTQLINAASTSSAASGDALGYTFALDNQSFIEVSAEADGSGGIQNGSVAVTRELSVDGDINATGVGHFDITGDADSVDGLHKADLLPSGGQNVTVGTFPNPTISVSPQGSGSGLNADRIDGYESAELAVRAEDETITGTYTFASEIQADLGLTSGDDLMPSTGYAHSIGSSSQKWLTLDVAELRASTLVSQKELATVGGRQLVGTASELTKAARASDTSVTVRHNNLRSGDYLRLESGGDVEFMKVTSSATSVSAGYEYSVERDLDSTGANRWEKGDALFSTSAGEGFIDLYAQHAFTDAEQSTISGPTVAFREQQPGYEAVPTRAAVGNLHDTYDYSTDTFGLAAGDKGATWIAADAEHGFRVMSEQVKKIGLDPSGDAYFEGEIQAESGQVGGWSIRRTRIRKDTPSGTVVEGGRLSSGGNIKLDQEGDAVFVDGEGILTGFGADAENVRAHVGTRGSDAELLVYRDADNYVSIGDGLGRSSMGISVQAGGTSILETRETDDFSSGGNSYPARIDGLLIKNGAAIEGAAVIDGTITASEADLTNIFSQTLTVNSGGEIKSGATAGGTPLFRIQSSGDARFGDPAGEHLTWDGSLSIDASTFDLEAGGLSIQSSSSTIELGQSLPDQGITLDGTGEEVRMYAAELPDTVDDHSIAMGPESDVQGSTISAVNTKDTGVTKNDGFDSSTRGTTLTLYRTYYEDMYHESDAVDRKHAAEMLAETVLDYSLNQEIGVKITYELRGTYVGTLEKTVPLDKELSSSTGSETVRTAVAATLRNTPHMIFEIRLEIDRNLYSGETIDYEVRRDVDGSGNPTTLEWREYRPRTVVNKYGITTHMGPNVAKTLGGGAAGSVGTSDSTAGVSSFEGRTGDIALQDGDVTGALGYVPVDEATTISAGTGLAGGGDLTQGRTLSIADSGVGTTQLAGDSVTPAKVDETGRYAVEGLEVGADATIGGFRLSDDGDLVLTDTNGIELIRQPAGGPTQFVQGAEIGVIDAPEDSLTQIINAASTSSSASGDAVGYTFAVDNQSFLEVSAESNSGGGIRNGRVVAHREVGMGSNQIRFDDGLIKGDGAGALQVLAADGTASGELVVDTLTVTGSIDEKDTTTLNVQDQWITVADGQSGTPSVDAGLIVERGDQPNARLLWSEGTDEWGRKMKGGTFEPFWHDGNVSGGTDIVMSSTQVAHANTGASLSVTTGEGEVVSALSTDGRGHVGSASVKSLSIDEWGAASGDLDLGGYNIENLHRIGDPDTGNYLDFTASGSYVEVQDGSGSREQLVAEDLYVSRKGAWLSDDDLIDLNAGSGLSGGGTTGIKDQMTIRHADTSTQGNAAVGGATVISEITLDDYGHLTGIATEDRSISDWAKAEADLDLNGKNVQDAGTVEAEEAHAARHTTENFEVRENPKSASLDFVYTG